MKRKELEKRYNNLVNIKCYDARDEVHGYVCEVCHKEVFTTCADKGVTPFGIICECGGAMSHLNTYRKDTFPKDIKVLEFRRPSFKEMLKGGENMIQHVLDGGLTLDKKINNMKQTVEEAVKEAIHKHYNCNGTYPCSEREYCEHCNGHNTAFDCCECGADDFKEGFISGANWQAKQSPWHEVSEEPKKE